MGTPVLPRREFLRRAGVGLGALSLGGLLAACAKVAPGSTFKSDPAGILNFANWSLYIDKKRLPDGTKVSPSLEGFTKKTGIQVNYREVVQETDWFFERIQSALAAGEPTGWDIIVITNGTSLTKMIELGYLELLPIDLRPNFHRYANALVKNPSYDPGAKHSMAWQSGLTGIAYNPLKTGRAITSLQDLFSTEFKGQVGMFGDLADLPNLALVAIGVKPVDSTPEDWMRAAALLEKQHADHIISRSYQQSYINALTRGDIALSMAWSGDIFQTNPSGDPNGLQFVVPDEGALIWTDSMMVPKGATHLSDAITFMDYVYQPKVAAQITQGVGYVSPVPAAKDVIAKWAEQAPDPTEQQRLRNIASSSLVFPTDEALSLLYSYRELKGETETSQWDGVFSKFTTG
jgi:spermidine/putrescine transport system substrate-binding protein